MDFFDSAVAFATDLFSSTPAGGEGGGLMASLAPEAPASTGKPTIDPNGGIGSLAGTVQAAGERMKTAIAGDKDETRLRRDGDAAYQKALDAYLAHTGPKPMAKSDYVSQYVNNAQRNAADREWAKQNVAKPPGAGPSNPSDGMY